jgi:hypothetical protein
MASANSLKDIGEGYPMLLNRHVCVFDNKIGHFVRSALLPERRFSGIGGGSIDGSIFVGSLQVDFNLDLFAYQNATGFKALIPV